MASITVAPVARTNMTDRMTQLPPTERGAGAMKRIRESLRATSSRGVQRASAEAAAAAAPSAEDVEAAAATALLDHARSLADAGDGDGSEALYRSIYDRFTASEHWRAREKGWQGMRAHLLGLYRLDRTGEAADVLAGMLPELKQVPQHIRGLLPADHVEHLLKAGRDADATAFWREVRTGWAGADYHVARAFADEVERRAARGDHEDALRLAGDAAEVIGDTSPHGLDHQLSQARTLRTLGRHDEALAVYDAVVAAYYAAVEVDSENRTPHYDSTYPLQSRAARAQFEKAATLEELGDIAAATELYSRVEISYRGAHAESIQEYDDASREIAAEAGRQHRRLLHAGQTALIEGSTPP